MAFWLLSAAYLTAVLVASILAATKTHWKLLPVLPAVFCCYHFSYGFGFVGGIWRFVIRAGKPGAERECDK